MASVGLLALTCLAGPFSHTLWDRVLRDHVNPAGLVDYAALRRDGRFRRYLDALARARPETFPQERDRLAFWLNAYNACMLRAVLDHLPPDPRTWPDLRVDQIRVQGKNLWQGVRFTVAGRRLTLDEIEHRILRGTPGLRDPRLHAALVCAARGCPPLARHAFTGRDLERQLEARMRRELNDPERTRVDHRRRTVTVSQVFSWYARDFTDPRFHPHADTLAAFVARYLEDARAARGLREGTYRLRFRPYDWRLNVQR